MDILKIIGSLNDKVLLIGLVVIGAVGILIVINSPPQVSQSVAATVITNTTDYTGAAIKDTILWCVGIALVRKLIS